VKAKFEDCFSNPRILQNGVHYFEELVGITPGFLPLAIKILFEPKLEDKDNKIEITVWLG